MTTSQPSPANDLLPHARRAPVVLAAGIGIAASLLVAATLLWVNYGTTVFFEMIAAGLAACF